jgi:hypothetical protein
MVDGGVRARRFVSENEDVAGSATLFQAFELPLGEIVPVVAFEQNGVGRGHGCLRPKLMPNEKGGCTGWRSRLLSGTL